MSNFILGNQTWDVANLFFDIAYWQVRSQHLDSYNEFIESLIPNIVEQNNPQIITKKLDNGLSLELEIHFNDISITEPRIHEKDGSTKVMYPNDARLRNLTYSSPIYSNVSCLYRIYNNNKQIEEIKRQPVKALHGKVPIMLHSNYCILKNQIGKVLQQYGECMYDTGGYFIITGQEKVIIAQETQTLNKMLLRDDTKKGLKYSHAIEVQSIPFDKKNITMPKRCIMQIYSKKPYYIKVLLPYTKNTDIPLFVLLRALGLQSDEEIFNNIVNNDDKMMIDILIGSLEDSKNIKSTDAALEYLIQLIHKDNKQIFKINEESDDLEGNHNNNIKIMKDILRKELLPHVGYSFLNKIYYLSQMANRLISLYLGRVEPTDRDHLSHKRINTSGYKLAELFSIHYHKQIRDMTQSIYSDINNYTLDSEIEIKNVMEKITNKITTYIKYSHIEASLKYALSTGNWGTKGNTNNVSKQGVAQVLTMQTNLQKVSHLRRINTPIDKTQKIDGPRKLHTTKWGFICPVETPEGASVGIVNNLTLMAVVTGNINPEPIYAYLSIEEFNTKQLNEITTEEFRNKPQIYINGDLYGICEDPYILVDKLRELRRDGSIHIHTSISYSVNTNEIIILTDSGRIVRPLYIVKDNKLVINEDDIMNIKSGNYNWNSLLCSILHNNNRVVVEYVDITETESLMIATDENDLKRNMKNKEIGNTYVNYTHCEIHPSFILGALGSIIPYSNHNQSPRNTYQTSMGKQALGIYVTNYLLRMDTLAHILSYPQKPIVTTRQLKYLKGDELPAGQNVILAIACYGGYNQEDSVVINQSAIDRGLFSSTYYRTYKTEEKKNNINVSSEKFCKPDPRITKGMKLLHKYDKLGSDGFVKINEYVEEGDVIIGKCAPLVGDDTYTYQDMSVTLKANDNGYVDRIEHNVNGDGVEFCKVRIRSIRKPQIGDKFATRCAQKGTCGMTYKPEDMPFTKEGITPDIIMNPHAIPTRMTIGQLIETLVGKVSSLEGYESDGTVFCNENVEEFATILRETYGFEAYGNETMYNGQTGEKLEVKMFIGPTYYQRLKHMIDDKYHSRSVGSVQMMTRQPLEGRSRDGGLRFGEMEQWCMISHGTAQMLKERSLDVSDIYKTHICDKCGLIATADIKEEIYECSACNNNTEISEVHIPYAYKLLTQELMAMNIAPRMIVN